MVGPLLLPPLKDFRRDVLSYGRGIKERAAPNLKKRQVVIQTIPVLILPEAALVFCDDE